ncbi:hypothetical protein BC832DRAFT_559805 [Gaertneriomyces semiglobifer]|nr:hypothetical protein BC832DRAFT_559805 [Gaertneriomyces semiglobifer]
MLGTQQDDRDARDEEEAANVKLLGNAFYKAKRLKKALQCYKQAITLSPNNAIYYSNAGACLFEMGHYQKCIDMCAMVEALSNPDEHDLWRKNSIRKARAFIYLSKFEEAIGVLRQMQTHGMLDADTKSLKLRVEETLQRQKSSTQRSANASRDMRLRLLDMPWYKPSRAPGFEFYPVGHDDPASALYAGEPKPRAKTIEERSLSDCRNFVMEPEDTSKRLRLPHPDSKDVMRLLFGGCGDCRHLYMTLLDLWNEAKKRPDEEAPVRVHILCNDIHPSTLARLSIILYLAMDLGRYSLDDIHRNEKTATVASTLMYTYLGAVMPPLNRKYLKARLRKLSRMCTEEVKDKLMLKVSEEDWAKARDALRFWERYEGTSAESILKIYVAKPATPPDFVQDSVREKQEAQIREMLDVMTAKEMEQISGVNVKNREQFIETTVERVMDKFLNEGSDHPGFSRMELEAHMLHTSGFILPPPLLAGRDEPCCKAETEYINLFKVLDKLSTMGPTNAMSREGRPYVKLHSRLFRATVRRVKEFWAPNPTLITEAYVPPALEWDPVHHLAGLWAPDFLKAPRRLRRISYYNLAARWFLHLGQALRGLAAREVRLEFQLGDVNYMLEKLALTNQMRFDRIHLSNVPDYTSILLQFITAASLMKNEQSTFGSAVLLNTGFYTDYAEAAHSTTLIPLLDQYPSHLGCKHVVGGLWDQHVAFSATTQEPELASTNTLIPWLHRVLLCILSPPDIDPSAAMRENFPLNVHAWFRLLERLVHLGFPKHVVAHIVATVTSSGKLRTTADFPFDSPLGIEHSLMPENELITLAPFVDDLKAAAALWFDALEIPRVEASMPSAIDIGCYTFPYPTAVNADTFTLEGNHYVNVLAILFLHPSISDTVSPNEENVRQLLVDDEPEWRGKVKLVTTCQCLYKESRFKFWMEKRVVDSMKEEGWIIWMVRCDSYDVYGSSVLADQLVECI